MVMVMVMAMMMMTMMMVMMMMINQVKSCPVLNFMYLDFKAWKFNKKFDTFSQLKTLFTLYGKP